MHLLGVKLLVLGVNLLKRLDDSQCKAVVAHELGHVKEKHRTILVLIAITVLTIPALTWSNNYSAPILLSGFFTGTLVLIMKEIALFAFSILALIPFNWYLELRADRIAAKFVGKDQIKSALLNLSSKKNLHEHSETHPSIADRINCIDNMEKDSTLKLLSEI